ncbi:50S ribosomal protein L2 [Candidatus Woesearchaeota archaeon]|jgi:large subunit ribosomal protein L2|nr:50S ribosomal protein L2 [Candidatus Woesearchaeota archaeon]MBT4387753.1 50S ribosomal protein L2 [Candidatus Woesearchaeota archaeon]MBT4595572.1 50S ribosomal protein L2 [Candidatus Woesearchaeota archaeon]MBT5740945.1 50S ribosomal protein L2 [Candidatus Woesearchaeota archaeon]MBT6506114.1 50S ribosomal protein L2 [Candidatus Woesearchaeota archaeon]
MGKRIISQRRGKGTPRYTAPSFNFKVDVKHPNPKHKISGEIQDIFRCRAHTAPVMSVKLDNGKEVQMIAPNNVLVNQKIEFNTDKVENANTCMLKYIPEGTSIFNIELNPGDGGKLVKTTGTSATIVAKLDKKVIVLLPSKKKKTINWDCRANIGVIAGGGRVDKPLLKAGNNMKKFKARGKLYPIVSANSMNATDHPFGNSRSSYKSKSKPAPKNAPPGRKVGSIRPRSQGRKKGRG